MLSMIDCQQDCPHPQSPINPMNINNNKKIYKWCWEGEVVYLVSEIVYFNIIFIFYIDMSNNFYCYMSNLTSFMLKALLVSFMWQEGGKE